jgi:thiol-disulfide isomerase/thioredoxin
MDTLRFDDQDPDYFMLFNSDVSRENIFEKNARTNTAKKISTIIEAEFLNEIHKKKTEIYKIYKNLNKACKMLHYLRFAIITDFYNQESIYNNDAQALKQSRLHCSVTSFARKTPPNNKECTKNYFKESNIEISRKRKSNDEYNELKKKCLQSIHSENALVTSVLPTTTYKIKKRIIIGNMSKWIIPDFRDGNATHKWTIYIRDNNKYDVGQFISKVRFFLHPSYKPNDVVELLSTPFYLSRYGWGEFPIRIQLHFTNSFNKPVDIIHYLKLDRTFTGLQTIGSETIVDLWINVKDIPTSSNINENNKNNISINEKNKKLNLSENHYFFNDHNYIGKNINFHEETCAYLQKYKEYTDFSLQTLKNNFSTTKICSNFNLETKHTVSIKSENIEIRPNSKKLPLIQKSNILEGNVIKHSSKNNKYKTECVANERNFMQYSNININTYSTYDNIYYQENLKALGNLLERTKSNNVHDALKLIMKRVPLISKHSSKSCYKLLHDYTSKCYQQFFKYSKGKQQSLERYRAINALNVIKNTKYLKGTYNINELIIWAKRYCYSPILNLKNIHKICISSESIEFKDCNSLYKFTSTISHQLNEWFLKCQTMKPNFVNFSSENDDQIDILNIAFNIPNSISMYHENLNEKNKTLLLIKYPEIDDILYKYVCTSVQQIGIKLVNEEIIPGVLHYSASLIITKAVEYLVDDLIRIAFSCALDQSKNERNTVFIKLHDIRMALLKKEEFEIFTNAGLGSEG